MYLKPTKSSKTEVLNDQVCLPTYIGIGPCSLATLSHEDLRGYFVHLEREGRLSSG